jgi:DNA-binding PadR family transcriptional regulator
MGSYLPILHNVRRKPNTLLPIEASILAAGIGLHENGTPEFYGFLVAREIKEREGARLLTAYGTLYKALGRMEKAGLLKSRWEDPLAAAAENRPRRRLYTTTPSGIEAVASARRERVHSPRLRVEGAPAG